MSSLCQVMETPVHIALLPLGRSLTVERGTPLQDLLFEQGVEFPCGGRGRCKGCRDKVLEGVLPVTGDDERLLTRGEIADGWRLACRGLCGHSQPHLTLLAERRPAIPGHLHSGNAFPKLGLKSRSAQNAN